MAAAAAAGLFLGVSAGRLMHSPTQPAALTAQVEAPATPLVASASPETTATEAAGIYGFAREEMFLLEVDSAVTSPRVDELYALDELTPHPREMMVAMVR
jgi:hypothetical protein